jgi:hypothetical protein
LRPFFIGFNQRFVFCKNTADFISVFSKKSFDQSSDEQYNLSIEELRTLEEAAKSINFIYLKEGEVAEHKQDFWSVGGPVFYYRRGTSIAYRHKKRQINNTATYIILLAICFCGLASQAHC